MFFAGFGLYLTTLSPTVSFWDSGELISAACNLGITHQPGYPLFSLVGRIFAFIPIGSIAFRVNVLSAAFSALTIYLVYRIILAVLCRKGELSGKGCGVPVFLSASLALVLGCIRVFWSQAVVAEVYALNSFFIALLILLYVRAQGGEGAPARYFMLSGFVAGLGIINHMSLVLYLPTLALTWLLLPVDGGIHARLRNMVLGAALMLLGLSVYMYLPIRAATGAVPDIGHPDTWRQFLWVIKWGDYVRNIGGLEASFVSLVKKINFFDVRIILVVPAAVYFYWRLIRDDWRLFLPLIIFLVLYSAGISAQVLGGEREAKFGLQAKFYIPVFMVNVIFIGALAKSMFRTLGGRYIELAVGSTYGFLALALLYYNYVPNDSSRNFMAADYAQNSLKSAGQDGVLFTWGDNGIFPLWYIQQAERYRDDVVLVHAPLLTYDWYLDDVKEALGGKVDFIDPYFLGENVFRILKAAKGARPVAYDYSSMRFLKLDETRLHNRGLVYFEGSVPTGDPWPTYVFRGMDAPGVFKGPMEQNIIEIYRHQWKVSGQASSPGSGKGP